MQTDLNAAMKVQRILRDARALLAEPGAWCKGALAVNGKGEKRGPFSEDVVSFDVLGAVYRVAEEDSDSAVAALTELRAFIPFHGVTEMPRFNDDPATTQKMVIEMFDRTIGSVKNDIVSILTLDTRK